MVLKGLLLQLHVSGWRGMVNQKQEIHDYVLKQYPSDKYAYRIDKDMNYLRDNYRWTEACADTVPAAMRCFYESTD